MKYDDLQESYKDCIILQDSSEKYAFGRILLDSCKKMHFCSTRELTVVPFQNRAKHHRWVKILCIISTVTSCQLVRYFSRKHVIAFLTPSVGTYSFKRL